MKKKSNLSLLIKSLKSVFQANPLKFIFIYLMNFLNAAFMVLVTYFLQKFFDSVSLYISDSYSFTFILDDLIILMIVFLIPEITEGIANFHGEAYSARCLVLFTGKLNEKLSKLHAGMFENHQFHEMSYKAYSGAYEIRNVIHNIMDLVTIYLPYFLLMGFYLFQTDKILPFILPFIFLPVILSQWLRSKYFEEMIDSTASKKLLEEHYKECLISRNYCGNTILLGAFDSFKNKYIKAADDSVKAEYHTERKSLKVDLLANFITLLAYTGIISILVYLCIEDRISLGALAAILASIMNMFSLMQEVFQDRLGELSEGIGNLKNYYAFLDLPENASGLQKKVVHSDLSLFNISFSYPGINRKVLDNITLTIPKNKKISVVGENGSGKTTLIKIILGLLKPDSGEIFYGTTNINNLNYDSYLKEFSPLFQNFQKYNLSLKDNIIISDVKQNQMKGDRYNDVIKLSDFDKTNSYTRKNFSDDIILGPEYGGIDLSLGEWQRLAMSRTFYREHNFLVLDEPTASIDPCEEDNIFSTILDSEKKHSLLYVTHRLGAAKLADNIIVMKEGKIHAQGTHEDLLISCKYYLDLWETQNSY